jgi:hypothetical protein
MKNRKRESCTSGTVRDEDGNVLIYSARPQRRFHTRQQPASATGQGTKSRKVERRGCGWRYGDLSLRDVMMVVAPRHEAGRRRMPRMPIQAAEQPERGLRMAI